MSAIQNSYPDHAAHENAEIYETMRLYLETCLHIYERQNSSQIDSTDVI